jgi:hypothetical protein
MFSPSTVTGKAAPSIRGPNVRPQAASSLRSLGHKNIIAQSFNPPICGSRLLMVPPGGCTRNSRGRILTNALLHQVRRRPLYSPFFEIFHVLRLVAVRRVLWPRLDCDCSTHGEAHRRPLRTRARRDGVWLGLCRSSDRRSDRGFRCRLFAHGICELPPGFLRRRGDVPHRRDAGADDRQAVIGGFRRGVAGASTRLGYFRFASIFSHPITS